MATILMAPAVGAAAVMTAARAQSPIQERATRIICPKDCVIAKVQASEGAVVRRGQELIVLDSTDEDRVLDRISLAKRMLSLQQIALSDEQVGIRRGILLATIDVAEAYADYARITYKFAVSALIPPDNGPTAHQAATLQIRTQAEVQKAVAALDLFDFNIKQAREKIALMAAEIDREEMQATQKKSDLIVACPADGVLTLHCFAGGFVSKGQLLAEVR